MGNKLATIKYNNNIGKTYKGLEVISWEQAPDKKNITYTLKNPITGELCKKQHSNIYKDLEQQGVNVNFQLSQINTGMIVELKNKQKCLVSTMTPDKKFLIDLNTGAMINVNNFLPNLTYRGNKEFNINIIFDNLSTMKILYRRPTYTLTSKETSYLEAAVLLGFKYIFKNKNQDVYVSNIKPEKGGIDWVFDRPKYITRLSITSNMFEFVKWSDDEALLIAGLL